MKILAVCLGNICRSPIAQGILEKLSKADMLDWKIDSAGTSNWHEGEAPCDGSIQVARDFGIDISHYLARQIRKSDFDYFDLILAMDTENYQVLKKMAPDVEAAGKIELILNFSYPGENRSVPDSYYTGNFREVFDLLNEACEYIVKKYHQAD